MVVVLGLLAAAFYGVGDFAGGLASRRRNVVNVLLYSYPVGALLMLVMLPILGGTLSARPVVFGICGGLVGAVGVVTMYGLMTVAPMNVISPVTAVLAAIVPVAFGVVIGERPHVYTWAGIALGILGVVLVSRTAENSPHGPVSPRILALAGLSGLGFGFYFVFLARGGHDAGMWTLVVSRFASCLALVPVAIGRRATAPIRGRLLGIVVIAGSCDALANMFFLLSSRHGLLSIASVLTSLYPAFTVLLAVSLLHEHTSRSQRVGLAVATAAVVLITV